MESTDAARFADEAKVPRPLHSSVENLLRWFKCDHLPLPLQEVVRPFATLATEVAHRSPSIETTVALRKLLEAKDAAVRAAIDK